MAQPAGARQRVRRRSETQSPTLLVGTTPPLPLDLAQRSVERLGWVALGYAATHAVVGLGGLFVQPGWIDPRQAPLSYSVSMTAGVVLGAVVAAMAWSRRFPPLLMLDLGLVFEVIGGLVISLAENAAPWPVDHPVRGHSSVELWVALFALIVPATLGKAILATAATALAGPVGLGTQVLLGNVGMPPPAMLVTLFAPVFVIAGCAVAISRFIYGLGAQVTRAREMGSYQLVRLIGRGGMGEVWLGKHRMLARSAAIKLIRTERLVAGTPAEVEAANRRFEREARATAALHSPHTVALYDYGISEDGAFYYVMEYLEGVDLESLVASHGPLPAARVVHLLRQVCDSLAEAHSQGITHRDIKPRNILACRLGATYDFVKVLDFGLVKFDASPESRLTMEGAAAGTPAYMAPEAALGARDIDHRADIYALGCVGWWLLTGRLVFDAGTPMAMALAHVQTQPAAPSASGAPASPELDRIILACLEKDRARRPQSAHEVERMLAACGAGEWTREDAERWWSEHPRPETTEEVAMNTTT
jgi:tRNA A-37 threonylcarbamoyl transferase component Bud32